MSSKREWVAVQHVPHEGPGSIATHTRLRGIPLRICRPYRGEALPEPERLAGLVVMGGPMGVADTDAHPNLPAEIELIATLVEFNVPVLGICLGAQLLARALGANVYPGPKAEIGPGTVKLTAAGRVDPVLAAADHGEELPVVHWHGETFDLPVGALRLASSEHYPNQAFRFGARAYGLQFHVEVDRALAEEWHSHLPYGVRIEGSTRKAVERAGHAVIAAFFDRAAPQR
ncbi:MAG TPA: type 1 glutamine amidotransferase [Solirubrobacteraceae bacterium]